MYFTLHFDILVTVDSEQKQLKETIKSCLKGLRWVKPLSNLYIVSCDDERRRKLIYKNLEEKYKSEKGKFRFLMSPLIDSGQYIGVTVKELWPSIKEITTENDGDFNSLF
jgi:hypothetical protein